MSPARRLTDEEIDRVFANAAAIIREVRESTQSCFQLPPRLAREHLSARSRSDHR
jgi:hypothetical protein